MSIDFRVDLEASAVRQGVCPATSRAGREQLPSVALAALAPELPGSAPDGRHCGAVRPDRHPTTAASLALDEEARRAGSA